MGTEQGMMSPEGGHGGSHPNLHCALKHKKDLGQVCRRGTSICKDLEVDGVTSSPTLPRTLRRAPAKVQGHIPGWGCRVVEAVQRRPLFFQEAVGGQDWGA